MGEVREQHDVTTGDEAAVASALGHVAEIVRCLPGETPPRPDPTTRPAEWRAWVDEHVACAADAADRRCYLPRVEGTDRCTEHG